MTILKKGTYFIGDPCYVLGHRWEEVCEQIIDDHDCLEGSFTLKDGVRFVTFGTAHGDGSFPDQDRHSYGVDAGMIGAVPVEAINPAILEEYGEPVEGPYRDGLGKIVNFETAFKCSSDVDKTKGWGAARGGVLKFGHITIDTDPPFEDEDEEDHPFRMRR